MSESKAPSETSIAKALAMLLEVDERQLPERIGNEIKACRLTLEWCIAQLQPKMWKVECKLCGYAGGHDHSEQKCPKCNHEGFSLYNYGPTVISGEPLVPAWRPR